MDIFSSIWDWVVSFLTSALSFIVDLLPNSPFDLLDYTPIQPYLSTINYFIPLQYILDLLSAWLIAVGMYYAISVFLRWLKTID